MRRATRLLLIPSLLAAVTWMAPAASAARIEAVKGKQYVLTKQHGPWMIMAASFKATPEEVRTEGLTPQQAADELVYELRRSGIPAYTFAMHEVHDEIETPDRLAMFAAAQGASVPKNSRQYIAQQENICVLAGNYDNSESEVAQKTLEWLKRFHPEYLRQEESKGGHRLAPFVKTKSGGVWRMTPGQPAPLSGAFLTVNPMLTPEEVTRRQRDPLLLKLNGDNQFSLMDNPGKYSIVVATFRGEKALVKAGDPAASKKMETFDSKPGSRLDDAGWNAWQLCKALRAQSPPIQAWVWHDRYQSLVTVGSFQTSEDPLIEKVKLTYGAKVVTNEKAGSKPMLIGEPMVLPGSKPGEPMKWWVFDPKPRVIEVPRVN